MVIGGLSIELKRAGGILFIGNEEGKTLDEEADKPSRLAII